MIVGNPVRHSGGLRFLLGTLIGLALLLASGSTAIGQADDPSPRPQLALNDAELRQQIERETAGSKLLQAMRRHFPRDYDAMIAMQIAGFRNGDDTTTLMNKSAEFTTGLRQRNARNFLSASPETHRAYVKGLLPLLDHLRIRHGVEACNALSFGGGPALMETLGGPALAADPVLVAGLDELGGLFLQAAAEGVATPRNPGDPTANDWAIVVEALDAAGMEQHEVDLAMTTDRRTALADPQYCDVSMKWIAALVEIPGDSGERIIRVIAGGMAGSL